ncbi:secreted phosphoprotein 24 [Eudromia elegans]
MRTLVFVLTVCVFSCSAFPVYDYELPVTEEALNASIARINSQSRGPNLYGVVRSHVRSVDMWNSNDYKLVIQFSIRETVCPKISGRDPFTCDFKIGPFVPTAFCRSVVIVSEEQITNMVVQCHQNMFSSESISSEEVRNETTCFCSLGEQRQKLLPSLLVAVEGFREKTVGGEKS